MKYNLTCLLPLLSLLSASFILSADEGQWQPHQLKNLQGELKQVGISLPAEQIADIDQYPMNAILSLGGCSAAFVSNKGLIITNHHCVYGAIARNSTPENNLVEQGFLAKSFDEELTAGSQRAFIANKVTNVTAKILSNLANLTGKERYNAIQVERKSLIKACETQAKYHCSVKAYHHGMEYFLTRFIKFKDLRLVYAPMDSVANFGGDIDNYEYPRHSADFSFLRAYVDKNGEPAAYSKDNVPYQPKSFLKVNGQGVKNGDGILLAGYPGSTSRYKLASEVEFSGAWHYPTQVALYSKTLQTITEATVDNNELIAKYSPMVKSINNRMKKREGLMDGFKATDIYSIKQKQEQALLAWIKQDKSRIYFQTSYYLLTKLLNESQLTAKRNYYFSLAKKSTLLSAAMRLYRLAIESEKPDELRESGYQARNINRIKSGLQRLNKRYDAQVDTQLWAMYLGEYLQQSADVQVVEINKALKLANFNQTVGNSGSMIVEHLQNLYQHSRLGLAEERLNWVGKSVAEFHKSDDAFIQLAVALYKVNMDFENQAKETAGQLAQVRPAYMKALIAYNRSLGKAIYPDANNTLRITYGTVEGYSAKDGIYKTPFTSLEGLAAKVTKHAPFIMPEKILNAIERRDYGQYEQKTVDKSWVSAWYCQVLNCFAPQAVEFDSVPVNFLSSADTTGGSSGSAVMNGKGELIGLNFDSTYESITKDWYFNPKITRAVHVDIRYVLWLLEHVEQADNLLNEMKLPNIDQHF